MKGISCIFVNKICLFVNEITKFGQICNKKKGGGGQFPAQEAVPLRTHFIFKKVCLKKWELENKLSCYYHDMEKRIFISHVLRIKKLDFTYVSLFSFYATLLNLFF